MGWLNNVSSEGFNRTYRSYSIAIGMVQKGSYIGEEAQAQQELLALQYPIENGIITSWSDMECIWHHTLHNELQAMPEEHPVIMTESPTNPKAMRCVTTYGMGY